MSGYRLLCGTGQKQCGGRLCGGRGGGVMKVSGRSSDASCEKFNMKNAAQRNKEMTLMTAKASRQEAEL